MLRLFRTCTLTLVIGGLLLAQSGCLNLGGRTTVVQEKPETAGRITALETRVSALEQALSTVGHPAEMPLPRTPDEETSPGVTGY